MRLLLGGDSHVVALGNALREAGIGDAPFDGARAEKMFSFPETLKDFFEVRQNRVELHGALARDAMQRLGGTAHIEPSDDVLVLCLGFTTTKLVRWAVWERIRPWSCPGRQLPVSDGQIKAMALDHWKYSLAFLKALRDLGVRLVVVEAPPPCDTDPSITERRTPEMLLTVDRLARDAAREALKDFSIVPTPPEAAHQGFLRPEYRKNLRDHHHAGPSYGRLVLPSILEAAAIAARDDKRALVA